MSSSQPDNAPPVNAHRDRSTRGATLAVYAAVALVAFAFCALQVGYMNRYRVLSAPDVLSARYYEAPKDDAKPFFSVLTNRTYATTDRARIWVNYRNVDALDFRVYKVKDPVKFFKSLRNPHQVGEDEQGEIAKGVERKPTFLERLREFKLGLYKPVRDYVRGQLQNQSRSNFNRRFREDGEDDSSARTPLNVADYARVPLLNPDQMVSSWREKLQPLEDEYDRRRISLGRRDAGVYLVEAVAEDMRAYGVCLVSDVAMIEKTAPDGEAIIQTVDRRSGAPRANTRMELVSGKKTLASGSTNDAGIYRTRVPRTANLDEEESREDDPEDRIEPASQPYLMMASAGEHFAISDLDSFYFSTDGETPGDELTSYLYTDRPVYRPAQRVYFKGILRRQVADAYKLPTARTVSVSVTDNSGANIYNADLPLTPRGTFSGEIDLPEESPLGSYSISAIAGQGSANGYFEVQEYKKPEYKVRVTTPETYVIAGNDANFRIGARYFFGAPVSRAAIKYIVYRSRYYPWWRASGDEEPADEFSPADDEPDESGTDSYGYYGDAPVKEGEGTLDAEGNLNVTFRTPAPEAGDDHDYTYRLEAQVTDKSRRTIEASGAVNSVRGRTIAYADSERFVYLAGDTARIVVSARTLEGQPVATKVKLTFNERRWTKTTRYTEAGDPYPDYETTERELSVADVTTNERGEAFYDYKITTNGSISIKTTIEENNRKITASGGSIYTTDAAGSFADYSYQDTGTIKLVPDKKSYRPGETARVLALLPHADTHLLVTTELSNVSTLRTIRAANRAVMIDVPIDARFAPDVFLNVAYMRGGEIVTGEQMLVVPARDKLLNVEIVANKSEFRPRDTAAYTIVARNSDGSPAPGAEVSFGVTDEAVYSIAPDTSGDIRQAFYGRRYNRVQTDSSLNYNFTGYAGTRPVQLAQNRKPYELADLKNDADVQNPLIRRIFKDTAFWQANLVTDAQGRAQVNVELPDNLTTWRATARAVTADLRVGERRTRVVSRKNLILRMALPRFLTAGDTVTLSAITHNYLTQAKTAQISLDITGAELLDPARATATINPNGEHRADFRVRAPASGELRLLAKSLTDEESDAIELTIPIVPRGARHTSGESVALAEDAVERTFAYQLPADADPNARSLRIEVAPSLAATLFGALDYLTSYPYGCTEQTMSSFLPNVVVRRALRETSIANVTNAESLDRKVTKGLRRLYNHQHADGGWGFFREDKTDAFMSAYVVDGLTIARAAGYDIDAEVLRRGRESLAAQLAAGKTDLGTIDQDTRAYAVYALEASGGAQNSFISSLFNSRDKLKPHGRALLALALHARNDPRASQVADEIERTARADASSAFWTSTSDEMSYRGDRNDAEATALSISALARIKPDSSILAPAARWLVSHRRHGHYWTSTRETAFAIYGLLDYLKTSDELTPDYDVEVYVDGEQVLAKRITNPNDVIRIDRRASQVRPRSEVRVVKRGAGVLYLANTLTYSTNDEPQARSASPGLKVNREYLRLLLDDANDDGTPSWRIEPLRGELRSGDLIVSRLTIEGTASRVLIEDPIPAGCEQMTEVGGVALDYAARDFSSWYSDREFRDNRTVMFVNYLDRRGVFQYAMRVQVPGDFAVAPARVEEMYRPQSYAHTASGKLTILDK